MSFIRFIAVLLTLCCLINRVMAEDSLSSGKANFRYGLTAASLTGFNQNDAKAALKAWSKSILQEQELNIDPQLLLYESLRELRQAFIAGKIPGNISYRH